MDSYIRRRLRSWAYGAAPPVDARERLLHAVSLPLFPFRKHRLDSLLRGRRLESSVGYVARDEMTMFFGGNTRHFHEIGAVNFSVLI